MGENKEEDINGKSTEKAVDEIDNANPNEIGETDENTDVANGGKDNAKEDEETGGSKDLLADAQQFPQAKLPGGGGILFKYCFSKFDECTEKFALKRCAQINKDNGCRVKRTSCMFKHFKKKTDEPEKCCLRYKCLGSDSDKSSKTEGEKEITVSDSNSGPLKSDTEGGEGEGINIFKTMCNKDIKDEEACKKYSEKECQQINEKAGCIGRCQFKLRHEKCCWRYNATCSKTNEGTKNVESGTENTANVETPSPGEQIDHDTDEAEVDEELSNNDGNGVNEVTTDDDINGEENNDKNDEEDTDNEEENNNNSEGEKIENENYASKNQTSIENDYEAGNDDYELSTKERNIYNTLKEKEKKGVDNDYELEDGDYEIEGDENNDEDEEDEMNDDKEFKKVMDNDNDYELDEGTTQEELEKLLEENDYELESEEPTSDEIDYEFENFINNEEWEEENGDDYQDDDEPEQEPEPETAGTDTSVAPHSLPSVSHEITVLNNSNSEPSEEMRDNEAEDAGNEAMSENGDNSNNEEGNSQTDTLTDTINKDGAGNNIYFGESDEINENWDAEEINKPTSISAPSSPSNGENSDDKFDDNEEQEIAEHKFGNRNENNAIDQVSPNDAQNKHNITHKVKHVIESSYDESDEINENWITERINKPTSLSAPSSPSPQANNNSYHENNEVQQTETNDVTDVSTTKPGEINEDQDVNKTYIGDESNIIASGNGENVTETEFGEENAINEGATDEAQEVNKVKVSNEGTSISHTVTYHYKGHGGLNKMMKPHHCNQRSICMALRAKNVCSSSQELTCTTKHECSEQNKCKCTVSTSCKPREGPLGPTHLEDLKKVGATRLLMDKSQSSQCQSVCSSKDISENSGLCDSRQGVTSCYSELSCHRSCACWVNIGCKNSAQPGQNLHTAAGRLEVPKIGEFIDTEKVVLRIHREGYPKDSAQWKSASESSCRNHAGLFDIGCSSPRKSSTFVFCQPSHCFCYIEYKTCRGEGGSTGGDAIDGGANEGYTTEGGATEGANTDGDATEGGDTEGDDTDGDATEGDATEGYATDGDATEGDATDGDATKGNATEGDNTGGVTGDEGSKIFVTEKATGMVTEQQEQKIESTSNAEGGNGEHGSTNVSDTGDQITNKEHNGHGSGYNHTTLTEDSNNASVDSEIEIDSNEYYDGETNKATEENGTGDNNNNNATTVDGNGDNGSESGSGVADVEYSGHGNSSDGTDPIEDSNEFEIGGTGGDGEYGAGGNEGGADYTESKEEHSKSHDYFDKKQFKHGKLEMSSRTGDYQESEESSSEYGQDYNDNVEDDATTDSSPTMHMRKTFYQAHIFPKQMLKQLMGGGKSSRYLPEEFCQSETQCPKISFFCGEDRTGNCDATPDCSDRNKKDDYCACRMKVTCDEAEYYY